MNNTRHLKILHIASGDLWAGAEVQLFTLAKTLHSELGVTVRVVLFNHGALEKKLTKSGIQVIVLDESELNVFQILRLIIRIIREQRPDVIHTHRTKENILGSVACLFASRTPSLRTVHGAPEHHLPWFLIQKRLIGSLDWLCGRYLQQRIVSVSKDLAEILKKDFPSDRINVIENGVDLQLISARRKKDLPITETGERIFRIGLAGRLVPVKNVDIFIETAQYTNKHYPDLKTSFHIFGDGPLRRELEQLSQELAVDDIVYFEGHCDDIYDKIRGLDVLLMTSDHEGLPMILLEAMALQTAIIAHAVGGIPDLLEQGSCGVLVREQDASAYAREIHRLAVTPHVLSDISKNALDRVRACYSAEKNARSYASIYSELSAF